MTIKSHGTQIRVKKATRSRLEVIKDDRSLVSYDAVIDHLIRNQKPIRK